MDPKLYRAAMEGQVEVLVQNMDQFGVQMTPNKNNVLHIAALFGQTRCVNEILRSCSWLSTRVNINGETPLHLAAKGGHDGVVHAIIGCARTLAEDLESGALSDKVMLRMANNSGDTALHEAVRCGDLRVVKNIIAEDPDFPHPYNKAEETPLYIAVEKRLEEIVSAILKTCTSPSPGGPKGRTALHAAVIFDSQGCTAELLAWKKALAKERDIHGLTPLHYAAQLGHVNRARQLLDMDSSLAYVAAADGCYNCTPLHMAAVKGHVQVMEELMSRRPDCCEMVDSEMQNILHLAAIYKKEKVVEFIVKHPSLVDSLINQKDQNGNTPLHLLAHHNFYVSKLITHPRVDQMMFNKVGHTPLDMCNQTSKTSEMLRDLKKYGSMGYRHLIDTTDELEREQRAYRDQLKRKLEKMKNLVSTNLIVAALIATVTFAAGFTLPGGYDGNDGPNQGMALLTRKASFKAFIITDTVAVTCSTCAVFIYFVTGDITNISKLYKHLVFANSLVITAAGAMMLAFVTGLYAVLGHSLALGISVCVIGCFSFLIYYLEMKSVFYLYREMRLPFDMASRFQKLFNCR